MTSVTLSYAQTNYFSRLICDYLEQKEALRPFYHRFPSLASFRDQAVEKSASFDTQKRTLLVDRLRAQNAGLDLSEATMAHIDCLLDENCFTVTTGHQLNLFTGPLYFFYKILSIIQLAEDLNAQYEDLKVVPVFWMATEDHDLEEINFFKFHDQRLCWEREAAGAVGRLSTEGMEAVASSLKPLFGDHTPGRELAQLFERAYLEHQTLAAATRFLVNELFGTYGLVIVDGDDPRLKEMFAPVVSAELNEHAAFKAISGTTDALVKAGYGKQVHPREINLFYLTRHGRHRIVTDGDAFFLDGTHQVFSAGEIKDELRAHPDRFSPNALLRPLYQEMILPNLCYVGGGGELAYWLQLKDCFKGFDVVFPILLLRNSLLLIKDKQLEKLHRLGRSIEDLFLSQQRLEEKHCREISKIDIDLEPQRAHLKRQFAALYQLAKETDASFLGAVAAQEKKQLNGLDKLEKRLLKAQKRKLADELRRLSDLHDTLFPGGALQERDRNFSEFYLEYGPEMIDKLKGEIRPLRQEFTVVCW